MKLKMLTYLDLSNNEIHSVHRSVACTPLPGQAVPFVGAAASCLFFRGSWCLSL